jgi:hypothetical protein
MTEEQEKRVPDSYQLKRCAPRDTDHWPKKEIDPAVMASYPNRDQVRYPYTNEDENGKFHVRTLYQDGHHPSDRNNLTDAQIGVGTQHLHDDWKRSPPEILDQDPEKSRLGYQSRFRVPDSAPVYAQVAGGDELGPSPEDRARKPRDRLDDGT